MLICFNWTKHVDKNKEQIIKKDKYLKSQTAVKEPLTKPQ